MSELIGEDISLTWIGHTCKVTGTVNEVTNPWTEYAKDGNNTGHFFPWQFADKYKNTEITVKGRSSGDRTATLDDDGVLVIRLENLNENKATVTLVDDTLTLDFAGVTNGPPVGANAVNKFGGKTDFGRYGEYSTYVDGELTVEWDGINGKVSGKLKHYDGSGQMVKVEGHHLPVVLNQWFKDQNRPVKIGNNTSQGETDWIVNIKDVNDPLIIMDGDTAVAVLDLTGLTLEPKG